jgi:hypothetical protein
MPRASGRNPGARELIMEQHANDQRSRVGRLLQPRRRHARTGRQGQTTSINAQRLREIAPAWDKVMHRDTRVFPGPSIGHLSLLAHRQRRLMGLIESEAGSESSVWQ